MWEAQKKNPFFSKSNFSPRLEITCVHLVADAKSTWSNSQKGTKIPKEYPGKIWTQTKTIWHDLTWVLSWAEQSRQTWLGATISPTPDHIFTWNSHKIDSPWHREETLHEIFGKICMFGCSASVWTRAEANIHVFDLFWRARARPGARPRVLAPSAALACALACA
jgi:hypothetical protein